MHYFLPSRNLKTAFGIKNPAKLFNIQDDWCVLQDWSTNWENIVRPCIGNMSWEKINVNSDMRTDASKSYIYNMELRRAGQYIYRGNVVSFMDTT